MFCLSVFFVQIWKVILGLNVVLLIFVGWIFIASRDMVCSISVFQDACVWVFVLPSFHSLSLLHLLNFDLNLCIICWKHVSSLNSTFTKMGKGWGCKFKIHYMHNLPIKKKILWITWWWQLYNNWVAYDVLWEVHT